MGYFESLIIYIVVFLCASISFYLSGYSKIKFIKYLFAFLGILILSFFAASRSDEVGRDIQGYVVPVFNIAKSSTTFSNFLNLGNNFVNSSGSNNREITYMILVYLCSKLCSTDFLLLFVLQFLTVTPVYIASVQFHKKYGLSIVFFMLLYMFLFYLNSFNIMRQSISCAFFLLGYSYQGIKTWKMLLSYILAILFHRMAFISIILLLIGKWISNLKGKKKIYPLILMAILLIEIQPLTTFLVRNNLLNASQIYYANIFIFGDVASTWVNISVILLLIDCVRRTLVFIPYFSINREESGMYELKNIVLVGYLVYMTVMITSKSVYGGRISLFTDFLYIPLLSYFAEKKIYPARYGYLIVLTIIIIFWLIWDLTVNGYENFQFRF